VKIYLSTQIIHQLQQRAIKTWKCKVKAEFLHLPQEGRCLSEEGALRDLRATNSKKNG
jgi:hypothetical protein